MSETNSSRDPTNRKPAAPVPAETPAPKSRVKPAKPCPDFPLYAHPSGQWAKKIRGRFYYFGPWADPDAALNKYLAQKEDLHAGRTPRPNPDALTLKELADDFLYAKKDLMDSGELSPRTWADYQAACVLLVRQFGKTRLVADIAPDDFASLRRWMAKKWGPHLVGKTIQCVRCVFKFAADNGLIDKAVRYGQGFKRPSKKTLRLHRAKQGPKLFTAEEVRAIGDGALVVGEAGPELVQPSPQLKAMILLGINCGFGNADCGRLPPSAVDLDAGMIDFARPKTGIARRCPMWPETVQAIREALAERPEPQEPGAAGLVFVTKYGQSWAKGIATVTHELAKLLKRLGINGRKGLGFYTLRHTFRTVADEAKDQPATDFIMGHEVPHMSSVYRETISDVRLRAVAEHVRAWLFAESEPSAETPAALPFAKQA
jgi:integrase